MNLVMLLHEPKHIIYLFIQNDMRLTTVEQIRDFLRARFDFAECIIESITFSKFATDVTISLDFIWDSFGNIRSDLDQTKLLVFLEFHFVRSFSLLNDWTQAMLDEPDSINWGLNEISRIRIKDENRGQDAVECLEIEFRWEGKRRIEIVFSELTVKEASEPIV